MKRCAVVALVVLSLLVGAGPGRAQVPASHEVLRLRVVNDEGGEIAASRDLGASWVALGHVLRYTHQVSRNGYTASKWVPAGHVAATAVNAIHISAGYNSERDRGVVFSMLPAEMLVSPKNYSSFLSPDSSIYTDLPAGHGMFGGGEAPFVGSEVRLDHPTGSEPMPADYQPAKGDVLLIIVAKPDRYPSDAVFENWAGGTVTLGYADGSRWQIGWVVKPVQGVGRFLGSAYADIGRLRASHAGVIDVSTSPIGVLGAFQIIPFGHALSPEMGNAWSLTQWLIVAPMGEGPGQWSGLTPLFFQHLRPDYRPDDLRAEGWQNCLLSRFLVDVDLGAGWQPMLVRKLSADPAAPLPEWAGSALAEVKRVRLLFPLEERESIGETP